MKSKTIIPAATYVTPGLVVLGEFRPHWDHGFDSFDADRKALWRCALNELLRHARYSMVLPISGEIESVEVREPSTNADIVKRATGAFPPVTTGWHLDCNGTRPGARTRSAMQWLACWASVRPTEIRETGSAQHFAAPPYTVVIFQNGLHEHRTPPMAMQEAEQRWFARAYLPSKQKYPEYEDEYGGLGLGIQRSISTGDGRGNRLPIFLEEFDGVSKLFGKIDLGNVNVS